MLLSTFVLWIEHARVTLVHAAGTLRFLKVAATSASFVAVMLVVRSSLDPASPIRRAASAHVRALDDHLRVLRRPPIGARVLTAQVLVVALLAVAGAQLGRPALLLPVVGIAIAPGVYLRRAVAKRRATIGSQVHGFALNLASTMRTTANIGDSLRAASTIAGGPLGEELDVLLAQTGFGSSLDDALEDLARRGNVLPLDVLVSGLLMARKTGGDVPQLMETTAASLREIHRLEEHASKIMTDPRRTFALMAAAPLLGFFGAKVFLPMIFERFLETDQGQRTLVVCAIGYVTCLLVGSRFVKVDIQ